MRRHRGRPAGHAIAPTCWLMRETPGQKKRKKTTRIVAQKKSARELRPARQRHQGRPGGCRTLTGKEWCGT